MDKFLDIGGGRNPLADHLCVDIIDEADIQCDLETQYLPFDNDTIQGIYTNHTLEHIDNIIHVMNEIYRVLQYGGVCTIIVPHKDCSVAWQDPTHKRYFVEESFKYFCGEYLIQYKLDYGICCCFVPLGITLHVPEDRKAAHITNIKFVLAKNIEWENNIRDQYAILDKNMTKYKNEGGMQWMKLQR